ncbi:MAG: hypothetical protein A3D44_01945 [Candidatus Staskawiczbacteria bacterium RIFCSPHIGHO2_02_FULL_42_22]|uniref:Response regulatory domain-containing protein n=1 Tax=Candidatus Staskawiczbacteria bacterium RIFCSPHIGHO2_02_FULL_42_22 TaxID=1802207 RepID=A0A1G2I3V0_9BACT|nr:MAG: hypothetical protein A3D44_01945 [Candidatus Staskawiczbacteria bacterium RIFCSPHIGHO2_02_FULL_42_22]
MLPKVLVVENGEKWQELWQEQLKEKVLLIFANTSRESWELFNSHKDISAIAITTCLNCSMPADSVNLVTYFRETFKGPVIATFSPVRPDLGVEFLRNGCTHDCEKKDLAIMLCKILGIS